LADIDDYIMEQAKFRNEVCYYCEL